VDFIPSKEDIFVDYPPCEYYEDAISTRIVIGTDGAPVIISGQTNVTFTVTVQNATLHTHVEIDECFIDVLEDPDDPHCIEFPEHHDEEQCSVLRNIPSSEFPDFHIEYAPPNGERAVWTAFIDNVTYSPWQRIRCLWHFYNGTTHGHYSHNHSVMLLNLDDNVDIVVH